MCADSKTAGLWLKKYGPHFFHTNDAEVWSFVQRFGEWEPYEHEVKAKAGDRYYSLPINGITLNELYNACDTLDDLDAYLEDVTVDDAGEDAESHCLRTMGSELYFLFFENYTIKQWGFHPRYLPASIVSRVPVRRDFDSRYFLDAFQAVPKDGYSVVMRRMLAHKNIEVVYGERVETPIQGIWTGRIDEYFQDHLDYRFVSVDYHRKDIPAATVNYPGLEPYTRETRIGGGWVIREYPGWIGEPAYPVPTEPNVKKYAELAERAAGLKDVRFAGRLGRFKYLNMDQAVREAINLFREMNA